MEHRLGEIRKPTITFIFEPEEASSLRAFLEPLDASDIKEIMSDCDDFERDDLGALLESMTDALKVLGY